MSTDGELERTFNEIDGDGDGKVTAKEFLVAMTARGETVTREEIESIFGDADGDADGLISFTEFAAAWRRGDPS
jgi:Ca2+-binding EF-hand superfamily protein